MPSANGVYSLPAGYLAVTGTTIQASQHNPPLEDIAAALTLRLSRDGTAPMTGGLQGIPGTASLPSFVFSTSTSTGIFKTTNGVGISVAGTQVAEFTSAGMASGVRMLGELVAWVQTTCPALFVFPVGQTLSRATYATLWAVAQAEITAGSTFFNNGDGSTTFGIGDLRGRTLAAIDNMGGTAANRLTSTYFGAVSGKTGKLIGDIGGNESHTLTTAELATHTHGVTDPGHIHANTSGIGTNAGIVGPAGGGGPIFIQGDSNGHSTSSATTGISIQNQGSGTPHAIVQPTILCQFIMFAGA